MLHLVTRKKTNEKNFPIISYMILLSQFINSSLLSHINLTVWLDAEQSIQVIKVLGTALIP